MQQVAIVTLYSEVGEESSDIHTLSMEVSVHANVSLIVALEG